jgi:phosphoribosyl-AMP cyclohydrolase
MLDPARQPPCLVERPPNTFARRCAAVNNGRVTDQPDQRPAAPAPDPRLEPDPAPAPQTALDPAVAVLLKRDAAGLVAAVVQEESTRDVLMVGWMDDEALHRTLTTGRSTFWSRSRKEYWVKGETSGHVQWVREVRLDCDGDTVLVTVQQEGAACHTGDHSCFDARLLPAVVGAPTGALA